MENAPFRKSVVDTELQILQKIICSENTQCDLNNEVGIGTFINKYNWNGNFITSLNMQEVSFRSQNLSCQYQLYFFIMWISVIQHSLCNGVISYLKSNI